MMKKTTTFVYGRYALVEMTGFDGFRLTLVVSTTESDIKNKVLVTYA